MHDLDRVSMQRVGELEGFEFEGEGEGEGEEEGGGPAPQGESPLPEAEVMELAAELLGVSQEQELQQILGGVMARAANVARGAIASPTGQAILGALNPIAQAVVPALGGIIPGRIPAGAALGLELEGLSHEDREFEMAKQFIRLASTAAAIAAAAPPNVPPHVAARTALTEAAKHFAPGLVGRLHGGGGAPPPARASFRDGGEPLLGGATSGRWFRRGDKIILVGA